jgi:hypothetical protein
MSKRELARREESELDLSFVIVFCLAALSLYLLVKSTKTGKIALLGRC